MESAQSMVTLLKRLWHQVSSRRKAQFGLLLILMIIASFAEIFSIGAVLPFLSILTVPEKIFGHPVAQPFIRTFGMKSASQLLLPFTLVFGLAAIISGTLRLFLLWASTRLSYATGADLSISIYRRTLYQPYSVHVARNSSEIINGISSKTGVVIGTFTSVLNLISATIILLAILLTLVSVDSFIALTAFTGFGLLYALIIKITRSRLLLNSKRIARDSSQVIKSLQEGLGGIRDVLIDGTQATYCQIYSNADLPLRHAQGNNSFISLSPRFALEA